MSQLLRSEKPFFFLFSHSFHDYYIYLFFSLCFPQPKHTNTSSNRSLECIWKGAVQPEIITKHIKITNNRNEQKKKRKWWQFIQPSPVFLCSQCAIANSNKCHWSAPEILMHRWLLDAGIRSLCVVFQLNIGHRLLLLFLLLLLSTTTTTNTHDHRCISRQIYVE